MMPMSVGSRTDNSIGRAVLRALAVPQGRQAAWRHGDSAGRNARPGVADLQGRNHPLGLRRGRQPSIRPPRA